MNNKKNRRENKSLEQHNNVFKASFQEQFEALVAQQISQADFSFTAVLDDFSMSRSTFQRAVKKHYACSPQAYLKKQRLLRAQQLLKQHKGSISELAYSVGFNSISYFNRAFKAHFGQTPSDLPY